MKTKTFQILIAALALAVFQPSLRADDGMLTAQERAKAIKLLKDSEARTIDVVSKLNEEQLNFKPAPDKWSVLEVAEHIMLSESRIFGAVQKATESGPNPDWAAKTKGKTEFLQKAMLDRSHKAQAPEMLVPTGKLSRQEVLAKFKEARAKTLKFAEETQLPLKTYTMDHPVPVIGTLNGYQWLLMVPLHNMRHNEQIDEVMANPNFPKNKERND